MEIRRITDDYRKRELNNRELQEAIVWYSRTVPHLLFEGPDYNPTIKRKCGERRMAILKAIIDGPNTGYQARLGE